MSVRINPVIITLVILLLIFTGCSHMKRNKPEPIGRIQLITLDPGHFHAALVQKTMYKGVDSSVFVYAPGGPDLELHLARIVDFNQRKEQPTHWHSQVYSGNDFFEKMLAEKKGNVVVLAGNNRKKTEYILRSVDAGFHVLADKPMAINKQDFLLLEEAFLIAREKNLLLYDIMTERYEITTILQREFSRMPGVFGTLEKGTIENPAVTKESVHHFFKYVSGNILTRPPWFFDIEQEGEGLTDVTTHLVDLIQWECYPDQVIDYKNDIKITDAHRWATPVTLSEFRRVTGNDAFPDYLLKDVTNDTVLQVYCNGEINYQLKDIHAKISVEWAYEAPEGGGDTHFSLMRGTKANLIIRQGKEQQYKPVLYIVPVNQLSGYDPVLTEQFSLIEKKYPGIELKKRGKEWEVVIPEHYHEGHEAHFAEVTEKFIRYLRTDSMPEWEVPNMIAKYYTTTRALEIARSNGTE